MPYESGMDPIGDARQRFDVRFYLVAIVFLLFDVELLFLYPWAVAQWSAGLAAGRGAWRRDSSRISRLGVLGDHGLHRDPGGGLRVRVAERGVRMAVGTPGRGDPLTARPGRRGADPGRSLPARSKCPRTRS